VAEADGGGDLVAVLAAGATGAVQVDLAFGEELGVVEEEATADFVGRKAASVLRCLL
jgi:hypothetical protein